MLTVLFLIKRIIFIILAFDCAYKRWMIFLLDVKSDCVCLARKAAEKNDSFIHYYMYSQNQNTFIWTT